MNSRKLWKIFINLKKMKKKSNRKYFNYKNKIYSTKFLIDLISNQFSQVWIFLSNRILIHKMSSHRFTGARPPGMDERIPYSINISLLPVWPYTGGDFSRILSNFQIFGQNCVNFHSFSAYFWENIFNAKDFF
jgi:hypothetical protein